MASGAECLDAAGHEGMLHTAVECFLVTALDRAGVGGTGTAMLCSFFSRLRGVGGTGIAIALLTSSPPVES